MAALKFAYIISLDFSRFCLPVCQNSDSLIIFYLMCLTAYNVMYLPINILQLYLILINLMNNQLE